jgi:hypothetical protein
VPGTEEKAYLPGTAELGRTDQKPFGNEGLAAYSRPMATKLLHLLGAIGLSSCATGGDDDPLRRLLAQGQSLNGQEVQVEGIFSARQGVANLYTRDRGQCIGLLTHNVAPAELASLEGRHVRASGRLMAEGCPKGGSCSEHLCGPAVLYNVRVEPRP